MRCGAGTRLRYCDGRLAVIDGDRRGNTVRVHGSCQSQSISDSICVDVEQRRAHLGQKPHTLPTLSPTHTPLPVEPSHPIMCVVLIATSRYYSLVKLDTLLFLHELTQG